MAEVSRSTSALFLATSRSRVRIADLVVQLGLLELEVIGLLLDLRLLFAESLGFACGYAPPLRAAVLAFVCAVATSLMGLGGLAANRFDVRSELFDRCCLTS